MKKHIGFTLIELLISLLLLSILASVAVPSFIGFLQTNRLKQAAETIYSTLKYTHADAVKRGISITTNISSGPSWCIGTNDGGPCDCTTTNDCQVLGADAVITGASFPSVAMALNGFAGNNVQIEGVRGTADDSGSIDLSINGQILSVTVSSFGRVGICSNNVVGYSAC